MRLLLTLLLIAATASPALAQVDLNEPLPFEQQTRIETLDNGLRYYIRENAEPKDRAELRLVVNAGSILEDEDQLGLAHFVEHMAFNGTANFEAQELVDYLETIGMKFGPDINAYTSFDETVYMLTIPTDDEEIVTKAFQILEDWARGIAFAPEEIDKERGVVIEEWRSGRGAGQRMRDKQYPILYGGSLYAERLPIGNKEILEGFEHDTLVRYYRDWYRPELMAVVAVGDFDANAIELLIRKHFSQLPKTEQGRERFYSQVPGHDETRFALVTDEEATSTRMSVLIKTPPELLQIVGDYRLSILEGLYNGMVNFRLGELTQKADPPFIGAYLGRQGLTRTVDAHALGVSVQDEGLLRGLEATLTEAVRVIRHGFTPAELERAKTRRLASLERQFNERKKTHSARYSSSRVSHFLDDSPVPGIEFIFQLNDELMPEITLEEINALPRDWFSEKNRVIMVNAPQKAGLALPTEEEIRAVFAKVEAAEVEPYVEELSEAPLVATVPVPGEIVVREHIEEIDVHLWTLSNGIRVYLKSTDFKEDEIVFSSFSPGGSSLAGDDIALTTQLTTSVIGGSGVGEFSRIDLSKKLAGKQVSVSPFVGLLHEGISGGARPQDLETLFQLIYLSFTEPRHDPELWQSMKSRFGAMLRNRAADPNSAYADTLNLTMTQYHPRRLPLTEQRLDEFDLDAAHELYRDRFGDAGDFTFTFVGALGLEEMEALVLRYLASLPTNGRVETWRDLDIDPPAGLIEKSFKRGKEPKSRTTIAFTGDFEWSRVNRHAISSLADVLRIRLREVLREDLGGVYGVSISGGRSAWPDPNYDIRIAFGCDPDRLEELVGEVFRVIEEVQAGGADEEVLAKVRESQLRDDEEGRRQNGYWRGQISWRAMHGIDQLEVLSTEKLIASLTAETIRNAANRYLRMDNYVRVSMVPEDEVEVEPGS